MNNVEKITKNKKAKSIFIGVVSSLAISCIFLFIYAIVLEKTMVKESSINAIVIIITAISVLIGSSISSLKIKKNGIACGVCVGGLYFLCLYVLSSIVLKSFFINYKTISMILSGCLFGGIGGIIGVNIKK